jgi:hypothetical protein
MTYKILSTRQDELLLYTTVEFNINGQVLTSDVSHFMPKSQEEIEQNIINFSQSEIAKINAKAEIELLAQTLPINEEKPIE